MDAIGLKRSSQPHHVVARQTGVCTVGNNSQCVVGSATGVPQSIVECATDGVCVCRECFERDGNSGKCMQNTMCPDEYYFSSSTGTCVDERPSQLVAFLLSLFLSSTGAANFYIGRNDLGELVLIV